MVSCVDQVLGMTINGDEGDDITFAESGIPNPYLQVISICAVCQVTLLSLCPSIFVCMYLSVCLSLLVYLSIYFSVHLYMYLSACLCVHLSIYRSIYLFVHLLICSSIKSAIQLSFTLLG